MIIYDVVSKSSPNYLPLQSSFARLLTDFGALATQMSMRADEDFSVLLREFGEAQKRADESGYQLAVENQKLFHRLVGGFQEAYRAYCVSQEERAESFNILAVMGIIDKEIYHSMALAWLLDRDIKNFGSHAQGSLGFQIFLEQFNLPPRYANCRYWVRREVRGENSTVDIEIACRGHFLIHIENKIWAAEGPRQTEREWQDICIRAKELGLARDDTGGTPIHALYLTPANQKPIDARFRTISWKNVIRALEIFAEKAKPPEVKLFASHYAKALRKLIS